MPNESEPLDRVFQSLSNPTRRAVVARLGQGSATMTGLAAQFDMALPSFLQHLDVLESAGLVSSEKVGRTRTYRLEPRFLVEAEHWLEAHRRQWDTRLSQLDDLLLSRKENNK